MVWIRKLVRWFLVAVCVALVLAIAFGVIGEFFIEAAKEKGLYDNPSAKLDAAVMAVSAFVGQAWVIATAAFVFGLTAGFGLMRLCGVSSGESCTTILKLYAFVVRSGGWCAC